MYKFLAFSLIFSVTLLDGCKKNSFEEYGEGVVRKYKNVQQIEEGINLAHVQKVINAYHSANGRYPASLEEVERLAGIELNRSKYEYNPESGELKLVHN